MGCGFPWGKPAGREMAQQHYRNITLVSTQKHFDPLDNFTGVFSSLSLPQYHFGVFYLKPGSAQSTQSRFFPRKLAPEDVFKEQKLGQRACHHRLPKILLQEVEVCQSSGHTLPFLREDHNTGTAGKLVKLRKVLFILCAPENALDHKQGLSSSF